MAGNLLSGLGSNGQAITITLASLGNNAARESTVIDNTSNLFLDALVQLKIKTGASSTSATGYCNVYTYATANNGTTYSDTATGSDAAITLTSPANVRLIGTIYLVANATSYNSTPFSVASAYGGILPAKWGLIVENKTGGTLDGTGGNFSVFFQGIYGTYT